MKSKRYLILFAICGGLVCLGCWFFTKPSDELNANQQNVYDEVVAYASSNDCQIPNDEMIEIKTDISNAKTDEQLKLELEIGKLKIDKIKTKNNAEKEIVNKKNQANSNSLKYYAARQKIVNIYKGNKIDYENETNFYKSKISLEYSKYISNIRNLNNNSKLATGFKESMKASYEKDYYNAIEPYQQRLKLIETQWKNKLEYDKYTDLIASVKPNLDKEISKIEAQKDNDLSKIDTEISKLKEKRV